MCCDYEIHEEFTNDGYYDCPICCERINDNVESKKSIKCCEKMDLIKDSGINVCKKLWCG